MEIKLRFFPLFLLVSHFTLNSLSLFHPLSAREHTLALFSPQKHTHALSLSRTWCSHLLLQFADVVVVVVAGDNLPPPTPFPCARPIAAEVFLRRRINDPKLKLLQGLPPRLSFSLSDTHTHLHSLSLILPLTQKHTTTLSISFWKVMTENLRGLTKLGLVQSCRSGGHRKHLNQEIQKYFVNFCFFKIGISWMFCRNFTLAIFVPFN